MELAVNDVVQITNPEHKWYPSLVVISELGNKIMGYCHIPLQGDAYIFLKRADIEIVGKAIVVHEGSETV